MVDFLIFGEDARQTELARLLGKQFSVAAADPKVEALPASARIVLPIPSAWPDGLPRDAAWEQLEPLLHAGVTVYGAAFGALQAEIEETGAVCVDLLADEAVTAENARLTAEAALQLVMRHTKRSLYGTRCAVIGLGRIGTLLCRLLSGLGATVCAVSEPRRKRAAARQMGISACTPAELASFSPSLVFNTAPAQTVPDGVLRQLPTTLLWVELASAPGGLPTRPGAAPAFSVLSGGSLPAKLLPVSAAETLYRAILHATTGGI